ncbi:MAG: hypothetical protein NUV68_08555, partial [Caldiserica bacterium]|nr:hypothetical protein [Caldisericota bacterium]
MKLKRIFFLGFICLLALSSCGGGQISQTQTQSPVFESPNETPSQVSTQIPSPQVESPTHFPGERIFLPPPSFRGKLTLEELLKARRSVRSFKEEELTLEQVGQLLWAAQGITSP